MLETINYKLALFLICSCHQTYNQFLDSAGRFIVPAGYRYMTSFSAEAYGFAQETFGYLIESDDTIVLAFRGTTSAADTVSDLIARQMPYPWFANGGNTHRGFTEIYASARKQILDALAKSDSHKKLIITGHSLGGALATLCALDLAYNTKFASPIVYTYGAPRVGDPTFAAAYNQKIAFSHRIVIESDLIPLIPPPLYKIPSQSKIYHYRHVKGGFTLHFLTDSFSKNHALFNYFTMLAKYESAYAIHLCSQLPSICPI
ncbi:lipase family protein [Paenibacillus psychroresistens]|uniref:Lipase family protein n=1 Tax=Paenibacillus psychroresistens TaxID=1778678 RepID=A0A6B8RJC9_9BACL|nr:lipase family protein [Paenibacillus psychroresistens]QGQ95496.1 lipase family protein [Paenibacillus psychroresistens]